MIFPYFPWTEWSECSCIHCCNYATMDIHVDQSDRTIKQFQKIQKRWGRFTSTLVKWEDSIRCLRTMVKQISSRRGSDVCSNLLRWLSFGTFVTSNVSCLLGIYLRHHVSHSFGLPKAIRLVFFFFFRRHSLWLHENFVATQTWEVEHDIFLASKRHCKYM